MLQVNINIEFLFCFLIMFSSVDRHINVLVFDQQQLCYTIHVPRVFDQQQLWYTFILVIEVTSTVSWEIPISPP